MNKVIFAREWIRLKINTFWFFNAVSNNIIISVPKQKPAIVNLLMHFLQKRERNEMSSLRKYKRPATVLICQLFFPHFLGGHLGMQRGP